jgi:hypothetical protein
MNNSLLLASGGNYESLDINTDAGVLSFCGFARDMAISGNRNMDYIKKRSNSLWFDEQISKDRHIPFEVRLHRYYC